jgi:hypothetical protein
MLSYGTVSSSSLLNFQRITLPPEQIIQCHNPEDSDNLKSRKVCEIISLGKLSGYVVITGKEQNQIVIKLDWTECLQLMFIHS